MTCPKEDLLLAAKLITAANAKLQIPADIAALLEEAAETCRLVVDDIEEGILSESRH